jgi:RNA polymerase sigma-70 factor (ECF subfamily)
MTEQKSYQIHQDLINQCRKGDRLAQKEIYRLYYKAMYNTCNRMLNNMAESEDVMQEAFLAAFLRISSYKGELSFGSWLKRIVINRAIDHLRNRKVKFEEITEKQAGFVEPDESSFNFNNNDETLRIAKIKEAVKLLPEGFRVVLTLALFEGYDHEEIAMILRISESTSRSQLARAKKKLAEYINEQGK